MQDAESTTESDEIGCRRNWKLILMLYTLFVGAFYVAIWQQRASENREPGNPLAFFALMTVVMFGTVCVIFLALSVFVGTIICFHNLLRTLMGTLSDHFAEK